MIKKLESFASEKGAKPAQVALAWLLQQRDHSVPIPGTKRVDYLEEDVGALEVDLSEQDVQMLGEIFYPGSVVGERYPPSLMAAVDKDI